MKLRKSLFLSSDKKRRDGGGGAFIGNIVVYFVSPTLHKL